VKPAKYSFMIVCLATALSVPYIAQSTETLRPGRYAIAAQTVMPHLEEMRRITSRETRCIHDLPSGLFPVLRQPAMTGCVLTDEVSGGVDARYDLVCITERAATGAAKLKISEDRITGVLEVKMGGKNMTFSQHIKATWRGDCAEPQGE
jgi:hypothetical protein